MIAWKKHRLTLVGAGPGDPDLITRKGWKALHAADVILYDALVAPELLSEMDCPHKVFVGKRAGTHSMQQSEINRLIVQMAFQYGHVVRLKGGDPFVFGRGYEEVTFARAWGLEVDVVPGLSSATSLPGLQQVPLTHRNLARSFWVLTATTSSNQLSDDLVLAARSSATLVILMGMRKLAQLSALFAQVGKQNLPVMIIHNGSATDERVLLTNTRDMRVDAECQGIGAPGIIVVGEVVSLAVETGEVTPFIHQVKQLRA